MGSDGGDRGKGVVVIRRRRRAVAGLGVEREGLADGLDLVEEASVGGVADGARLRGFWFFEHGSWNRSS